MSASLDTASISVVVPIFNDVGRVGDALESIVGQSSPPGEVVVSDDGSDDGIERFVQRFAAERAGGPTIRYTRLASRSGDAAARNAGIAATSGDWIAICDSDDVWAPTKLERQAAFLAGWRGRQRIVLLGTHGYNMNDAKKVISPAVMGPTSEEEYAQVRASGGLFYVIHSSAVFSRADFEALGGYSTAEYGAANEFHFFGRLAERGVVMNLPEPLVYYRKRAGSMQLDRFWNRHENVMRLTENERRRANGESPLDGQQYAAQLARAPAWSRFLRRKHAWGMYYYRAGATNMVNERRLRGGGQLLVASLLDGARLRAGLRNLVRGRLAGGRLAGARDARPQTDVP